MKTFLESLLENTFFKVLLYFIAAYLIYQFGKNIGEFVFEHFLHGWNNPA
jgi:hypothetical protein